MTEDATDAALRRIRKHACGGDLCKPCYDDGYRDGYDFASKRYAKQEQRLIALEADFDRVVRKLEQMRLKGEDAG